MDNIEEIIIKETTTDPSISKETKLVNISDYQQFLLEKIKEKRLRHFTGASQIEIDTFNHALDQVEELFAPKEKK